MFIITHLLLLVEMGLVTQVQILEDPDDISLRTYTFVKGMNPSFFPHPWLWVHSRALWDL